MDITTEHSQPRLSGDGLLLFLFFVTSTVCHFLTKRIEDDVKHLVLVEDAIFTEAIINLGQFVEDFPLDALNNFSNTT